MLRLDQLEIINDDMLSDFSENIEKTKRLYFHSYCPDGIMGRNLLLKYVPFENMDNADFLYPVTAYKKISVTENSLFVDTCPPADQLEDFLKAGAKILDHHVSRLADLAPYIEKYPNQILFGLNSKGESGAVLAYEVALQFSWISSDDTSAAELAGIADCFLSDDPRFEESRSQSLYLNLLGNSYYGIPTPHDRQLASIMFKTDQLRTLNRKKNCILKTINGFNVAFYNGDSSISDLAEMLRLDGMDLIVGWELRNITLDGKTEIGLSVSLRSNDKISAGYIASTFKGGGGHDRAAGFRLHTSRTIFSLIEEALYGEGIICWVV
jgi:hypothetical protein